MRVRVLCGLITMVGLVSTVLVVSAATADASLPKADLTVMQRANATTACPVRSWRLPAKRSISGRLTRSWTTPSRGRAVFTSRGRRASLCLRIRRRVSLG